LVVFQIFALGVSGETPISENLECSTEDYDIGKKFFYYMQIESLKEYIMIDSVKCLSVMEENRRIMLVGLKNIKRKPT